MLDTETKRRIDTARDILVGKVPDPKSQVEQITLALIYKFMDDMDVQSVEWGGVRSFFTGDYERYAWSRLFDASLGGFDMLNLYSEGLTRMGENPNLPLLFRSIFKNAFLPFRDAETLRLFLKTIHEFTYDHSERLGDAYEYLLSVLGSQGDAGQFRTPRHIIDFIVQVVNPQKDETILDPACGTAGFLISAYKHILSQNTKPGAEAGSELHTDERNRLVQNFTGYDIDPGMIRNAQVNLYLHQFPDPRIFEYDTLSDEDRWNDTFDIILANPPFMTPKGFKATNKRYRIQANRSEVLFVDYIAEHIHPLTGRAAIIVPEGIIFQSSGVYQALRRMLVQECYLWAVVSLPAGVFQPYSGVKTSILFLDRRVAARTDRVHFVKIQSDGFDLGAQRRANTKSDLPAALEHLTRTREAILTAPLPSPQKGETPPETTGTNSLFVEKAAFGEDFNLSMDRYRESETGTAKWEMVRLGEVAKFEYGFTASAAEEGNARFIRITDIDEQGQLRKEDARFIVTNPACEPFFLKRGDLLVARTGATFGKTVLFNEDYSAVFASYLIRIQFDERVLPEFYWNFTKTDFYWKQANELATGGGQPQFNANALKEILIPLPPLSVQRALVAQIEQWQQVAKGARQVVRHYKPHIEVGEDWERVKLGEVLEFVSSGATPLGGRETYLNEGILFIRSQNVLWGECDYSDAAFISPEVHSEMRRSHVKSEDVFLNITGASIGRSAIYELEEEANVNQHVAILRTVKNVLLPRFLMYQLLGEKVQNQIWADQSGGTRQALNYQQIKNLEIPLPPLSVQQKIVADIERERALVSAARELVSVMEAKIKNLIGGLWERAG